MTPRDLDTAGNSAAATTTALCDAVLDEVERAVVGKRDALTLILTAVLAGGHVLIEDLPGMGKTLIARSMAAALGLDVGLSDMLTLTPLVGFRYYLPTQWESLSSPAFFGDGSNGEGIMNEKSSIRQFYAGLRVGLRLDQR